MDLQHVGVFFGSPHDKYDSVYKEAPSAWELHSSV